MYDINSEQHEYPLLNQAQLKSPGFPGRLSSVFSKTSASYKYFWFISILDLFCLDHKIKIPMQEIIATIIANAWYSIHYFKLSFGRSDSLYQAVIDLQKITSLPIDADKTLIIKTLIENKDDSRIKPILKIFTLNVPYRFLSPWIKYTSDSDIVKRSQSFENNCLYAITGNIEKEIVINPNWADYLKDNYKILMDFCYWNLSDFVQSRNPNVPNIQSKLIKPIKRNSLSKQQQYWNRYISHKGSIRCIYTDNMLLARDYDLDHFMPWSFVSHDLIWNLLPIDSSINSSKSNRIPSLSKFLPSFVQLHHSALIYTYNADPNNRLIEDYQSIGASVDELVHMEYESFYDLYNKTIAPLSQIAINTGFVKWEY